MFAWAMDLEQVGVHHLVRQNRSRAEGGRPAVYSTFSPGKLPKMSHPNDTISPLDFGATGWRHTSRLCQNLEGNEAPKDQLFPFRHW